MAPVSDMSGKVPLFYAALALEAEIKQNSSTDRLLQLQREA